MEKRLEFQQSVGQRIELNHLKPTIAAAPLGLSRLSVNRFFCKGRLKHKTVHSKLIMRLKKQN